MAFIISYCLCGISTNDKAIIFQRRFITKVLALKNEEAAACNETGDKDGVTFNPFLDGAPLCNIQTRFIRWRGSKFGNPIHTERLWSFRIGVFAHFCVRLCLESFYFFVAKGQLVIREENA